MEWPKGPTKEWWGLYEDGELIAVGCYVSRPSTDDFAVCTFSWHEYEVWRVYVTETITEAEQQALRIAAEWALLGAPTQDPSEDVAGLIPCPDPGEWDPLGQGGGG